MRGIPKSAGELRIKLSIILWTRGIGKEVLGKNKEVTSKKPKE